MLSNGAIYRIHEMHSLPLLVALSLTYFIFELVFFAAPRAVYRIQTMNTNFVKNGAKISQSCHPNSTKQGSMGF